MALQKWEINGTVEHLIFCPKAPGVDLCDPREACEGHPFPAQIDALYVEAPDEARASWKALDKLKGAYAWPQWMGRPLITLAEAPVAARRPDPASAPLPGFEGLLRRGMDRPDSTATRQRTSPVELSAAFRAGLAEEAERQPGWSYDEANGMPTIRVDLNAVEDEDGRV